MGKCLTILCFSLLLSAVLAFKTAFAVTENTDAVIVVIVPVAGTENLDLQFGKVSRPTSGTNTVKVTTADVRTISGAGDGALVTSPVVRAAEYTITGTAGQTLTFEASETSSVTGLSLDNFRGRYDGGSEIDIDVGDGASVTSVASATFEVGADLTIQNTASSGSNTLAFDLEFNFQ